MLGKRKSIEFMVKYYTSFKNRFAYYFPLVFRLADKNKKIIKFVFSGSVAAVVDLGTLYILTEFLGFFYLVSAGFSYFMGFLVSFSLQKFWTFRDSSLLYIKKQFFHYSALTLGTLFLDLLFLYILVEKLGVYYLLAQIIAGAVIALGRFLVNNFIIFKKTQYEISDRETQISR